MSHAELTSAEIENMVDISIRGNDCHRALYWMALLGREEGNSFYVEEKEGVVTVGCGESAFTITVINGHPKMAYP